MNNKPKIDDRRTFLHTQMCADQIGKAKTDWRLRKTGDRLHECRVLDVCTTEKQTLCDPAREVDVKHRCTVKN